MKFHDYHLQGYVVSDFGRTIVLDLVYDYPGQPIFNSRIEFTDVAWYHFIHTASAIITDILATPISTVLSDHASQIFEWNRQQGVTDWPGSVEGYKRNLIGAGLSAWYIYSAVGFSGFVIGKEVRQIAEQ